MKVDGSLKSLVQGVSQQPPRTRIPGQCTAQDNMSSNPVDGLTRRPPVDWIAALFSSLEAPQFYDYNQGDKEFIVACTTESIRVFGVDGVEYTVTHTPEALEYLDGSKLEFTSLDNQVFIANTQKVVEMVPFDPTPTPTSPIDYGSVVYVRGGQYARTYKIKLSFRKPGDTDITEISVSHTTPDGSTTSHGAQISTSYIANELYKLLLGVSTDFDNAIAQVNAYIATYRSAHSNYQVCLANPPGGFGCFGTANQLTNTANQLISWCNTALAEMTTPDATMTAQLNFIKSEATARNALTNAEVATFTAAVDAYKTVLLASDFNQYFRATLLEDVIYITWLNTLHTDKFNLSVEDGMLGTNIIAVNSQVRTISQLPRYAPHNFYVAVTGEGSAGQDDWYLLFNVNEDSDGYVPPTGGGFGKPGVWVETHKTRIDTEIDVTTMPHILEYDPDTEDFRFYAPEWKGRQVGDEDSNANPSFIGRKINAVSYFQSRLVFLSGPAVIMSRTNKPLDFWIETATAYTDTDAIDIESTAHGVTDMLRAIPHNRDLVVFANGAQFIVFGRNLLTSKNSSLVLTTSFESNLDASPVSAGRNIFFGINYGMYAGIREFYTEGSQDINDSRPITQHVLKYIPGQVQHLASSSNFDSLLVRAAEPTVLYNYEYIWMGSEKAQSSWSRWILPNEVSYFFYIESMVYIIMKIDGAYCLTKMDLNAHFDEGVPYQVKLDRKVSIDDVHTQIVAPMPYMPPIESVVCVQGLGCPYPGMLAQIESYDAMTNTITLREDMQGGRVILGQKYLSSYTPTIPFVKDQDGVKVGTGTLIIGKFFINCKDSGILQARVYSPYRSPAELRFTGRVAGNPSTVVGEPAVTSESFVIPFRDNADYAELDLFTDSHLPLTIMDIEWVGQYNKRGRRITQGE